MKHDWATSYLFLNSLDRKKYFQASLVTMGYLQERIITRGYSRTDDETKVTLLSFSTGFGPFQSEIPAKRTIFGLLISKIALFVCRWTGSATRSSSCSATGWPRCRCASSCSGSTGRGAVFFSYSEVFLWFECVSRLRDLTWNLLKLIRLANSNISYLKMLTMSMRTSTFY